MMNSATVAVVSQPLQGTQVRDKDREKGRCNRLSLINSPIPSIFHVQRRNIMLHAAKIVLFAKVEFHLLSVVSWEK